MLARFKRLALYDREGADLVGCATSIMKDKCKFIPELSTADVRPTYGRLYIVDNIFDGKYCSYKMSKLMC